MVYYQLTGLVVSTLGLTGRLWVQCHINDTSFRGRHSVEAEQRGAFKA